ncbi:MAG: hypothetical protein J5846_02325 [Desulfovibrio sp.]|nr:hypothetical protein [Desulfovibrio sp.]
MCSGQAGKWRKAKFFAQSSIVGFFFLLDGFGRIVKAVVYDISVLEHFIDRVVNVIFVIMPAAVQIVSLSSGVVSLSSSRIRLANWASSLA